MPRRQSCDRCHEQKVRCVTEVQDGAITLGGIAEESEASLAGHVVSSVPCVRCRKAGAVCIYSRKCHPLGSCILVFSPVDINDSPTPLRPPPTTARFTRTAASEAGKKGVEGLIFIFPLYQLLSVDIVPALLPTVNCPRHFLGQHWFGNHGTLE